MLGITDRKLILIVEDDRNLLAALRYNFVAEGFEVALAGDGGDALTVARDRKPDIILLDLMLPVMSGLEVCRALRRRGDTMPIIMLTARDAEADRVDGLNAGADDYVIKPFSTREVIARVNAQLRRIEVLSATRAEPAAPVIREDGLEIDPAARTVHLNGNPVSMRPKEFDLLLYMASRPGRVVTREQFLRDVWGYRYGDEESSDGRTVDVHVRWVRTKIETDSSKPQRIVTVRGVGYRYSSRNLQAPRSRNLESEVLAG